MEELEPCGVRKEFLEKDVANIIGHSIIVSRLSYMVGKELGIPDDLCQELAVAGVMHDIGKIRLDSFLEISHRSKQRET